MVFSDGECPNCSASHLHLNTSDLLECPSCHLVCAGMDGLVATVMPFRGAGNFRFEDSRVAKFCGTAFAPSKTGGVVADDSKLFMSTDELRKYLATLSRPRTERTQGQDLARRFFKAFEKRISDYEGSDLQRIATSNTQRTQFYASSLLPRVAADLGMVHGKEEFKVDHVAARFGRNGYAIPSIYVESENSFSGATHEIRKLCSLNSPLRVLITFTQKPFTPEPAAGAYLQLREWQAIIREHHEGNEDFRGTVAVIVARVEKERRLTFTACAFHKTGDLAWPLSVLVERVLD
ncbi:hypothetical protein [Variovorax gossypii]|uniref:hypothetical protein n=1 Tax=Variovorax gossypii TaxID=1679495 RepID=UPI001982221C|nr:hypothetical protein [Variovorax gossypii]